MSSLVGGAFAAYFLNHWRNFGGPAVLFNTLKAFVFGRQLRVVQFPEGHMRTITIRIPTPNNLKKHIAICNNLQKDGYQITQLGRWLDGFFLEPISTWKDVRGLEDNNWIVWTTDSSPLPRKGVNMTMPGAIAVKPYDDTSERILRYISDMKKASSTDPMLKLTEEQEDMLIVLALAKDEQLLTAFRSCSKNRNQFHRVCMYMLKNRKLLPQPPPPPQPQAPQQPQPPPSEPSPPSAEKKPETIERTISHSHSSSSSSAERTISVSMPEQPAAEAQPQRDELYCPEEEKMAQWKAQGRRTRQRTAAPASILKIHEEVRASEEVDEDIVTRVSPVITVPGAPIAPIQTPVSPSKIASAGKTAAAATEELLEKAEDELLLSLPLVIKTDEESQIAAFLAMQSKRSGAAPTSQPAASAASSSAPSTPPKPTKRFSLADAIIDSASKSTRDGNSQS